MTTEDTLARLEALCEQATSGEWVDDPYAGGVFTVDGIRVAKACEHNAPFIAASRTALPALLRVARAAAAAYDYYSTRERWPAHSAVTPMEVLREALEALGEGVGS